MSSMLVLRKFSVLCYTMPFVFLSIPTGTVFRSTMARRPRQPIFLKLTRPKDSHQLQVATGRWLKDRTGNQPHQENHHDANDHADLAPQKKSVQKVELASKKA